MLGNALTVSPLALAQFAAAPRVTAPIPGSLLGGLALVLTRYLNRTTRKASLLIEPLFQALIQISRDLVNYNRPLKNSGTFTLWALPTFLDVSYS